MNLFDLAVLVCTGLYAYSKALRDSNQHDEYWHIGDFTSYAFLIYAGWLWDVHLTGDWIYGVIALWGIGQVPFEGILNVMRTRQPHLPRNDPYRRGTWYGNKSRSLPIEWLPNRFYGRMSVWFAKHCGGKITVEYGQIKFSGYWAVMFDLARLVIFGGVYLLVRF